MARADGEGGAAAPPRLEIAIALPNGGRIGPDDIALLETLAQVRSILGSGRALGISYRKTWLMVDALNRMFETRVVDTFPGRRGAGAELTVFGARLIALYRSSERRAAGAAARALEELAAGIDPAYAAGVSAASATAGAAADPRD